MPTDRQTTEHDLFFYVFVLCKTKIGHYSYANQTRNQKVKAADVSVTGPMCRQCTYNCTYKVYVKSINIVLKKGKDAAVQATKVKRGRRVIAPLILNPGVIGRSLVNWSTSCPSSLTFGKQHWHPLNRGLGGLQNRSERFGKPGPPSQ